MGGERIKESEGVKDSKEILNFIEVQGFIFFLIFFSAFRSGTASIPNRVVSNQTSSEPKSGSRSCASSTKAICRSLTLT